VVPTLLIDGERLTGVPTLEELRARVQHATRTGG
jgi:protein-disulfide isomerase